MRKISYGLSDWGKRIVLEYVVKKKVSEKIKENEKDIVSS